jgi:hypothetical protein
MNYSKEHLIEGPMDMVIEVGLDRSRDVKVYPNVTKTTVKSKETNGHITKIVVETLANGDIPPALRKIILPKMLTWTEYGTWDAEKKVYEYKVKTFFFSNITNIWGRISYKEPEPGKTLRRIEAGIEIKMPILGQIVEKKVSEVQLANLDLDVKAMRDEVREMLAKQGKK